jgi:preprotein translocase subunit SecD
MVYGEKEMKKLTFKIWLLIVCLILSAIAIFGLNPFQRGVEIISVEQNSSAFEHGLRQGQIITSIDGVTITNVDDFSSIMNKKYSSGNEVKTILTTKNLEVVLFSKDYPEIIVQEIPKTNIKMGLDLAGGSRALVQAQDKELTTEELNDLVSVTSKRLDAYGISDIKVSPVSDLSGNKFMLIEIARASPKDLKNLIEKQGKFEAKIGNDTVFVGGNQDIKSVCRNDATCAGIQACQQSGSESYYCKFQFSIYIGEDAAKRQADLTNKLSVNTSTNGNYLSKSLDLYVDDNMVDTLQIGVDLKGSITTQIAISGSGTGTSEEDAYKSAEYNMHQLQTILITGSLPYKLQIVKLDSISPNLGEDFIKAILIAGIAAAVAVSIIIFFRYKKIKSSLALLLTAFSEIFIILGIACIIDWRLDLLSIAGILATIGTGIDQQIIIIDEARQKKVILSLKEKLKRAFAIILGSYFTVLVSLLPLMWAGAGLLKGFAITTIIGITVGVLITRPAFTDMMKLIEE